MGYRWRRARTAADGAPVHEVGRRSIDGEVLIRRATSRWDRSNQLLVTAASIGALAASVLIGISSWSQQNSQRDAVVDADRQDAAFRAIASVRPFVDSGQSYLDAVYRLRITRTGADELVDTTGGQFEALFQSAFRDLSVAALKSIGYESHDRLLHMRDVVAKAHLALTNARSHNAHIVTGSLASGGPHLSLDGVSRAISVARSSLRAADAALENTQNTVTCELGYRNGAGETGLRDCPMDQVPEPTVSLPPGP